jgi:hypothetical protein
MFGAPICTLVAVASDLAGSHGSNRILGFSSNKKNIYSQHIFFFAATNMIAYFNLIILFRRIDQTKRFNAVLKHRNIKPA